MNNDLIELTDKTKERLRILASETGLSGTQLADRIGITRDKYKNIVRNGGNKTIDPITFSAFTQYYDCTPDYLFGESDERMKDRNGETITHPVTLEEKGIKLNKIQTFLNKSANIEFADALHYMLFNMPYEFNQSFMDSIISIHKTIRDKSFFNRKDNLSSEAYSKIAHSLTLNDKKTTAEMIKLAEADRLFSKKKFYKAFCLYAELVLIDKPIIWIDDSAKEKIKGMIIGWPTLSKLDLTEQQRKLIESLSLELPHK